MDIGSSHGGLASRLSNFQFRQCGLFLDSSFLPEEIKNNPIFTTSIQENTKNLPCLDSTFYIPINSFEGALQSLKFDKLHIAIEVCKLSGMKAKFKGKNRNKAWKSKQTLWFCGVPMERKSETFQKVLDFIYISMWMQNKAFRDDLAATKDAVLVHSMGKNKETDTVLTEREFCSRLSKLRNCSNISDIKKLF